MVVRVSRGEFTADRYEDVRRLIAASASPLVPAIEKLRGLIYYHAGIDSVTNTVVNVSVWTDVDAAKQMETLVAMQAQRPILEGAGVKFDRVANYEPLWTIEPGGLPSR